MITPLITPQGGESAIIATAREHAKGDRLSDHYILSRFSNIASGVHAFLTGETLSTRYRSYRRVIGPVDHAINHNLDHAERHL